MSKFKKIKYFVIKDKNKLIGIRQPNITELDPLYSLLLSNIKKFNKIKNI